MAAGLLMAGGGTLTMVFLASGGVVSSNPVAPSGPQWLVVRLATALPTVQAQALLRTLQATPGVLDVTYESRAASTASYQVEVTDQRAAQQVTAAVRGMPGVVSVTAR